MDNFFSRFVLSDSISYRIGRHAFFWLCCWAFMGFIYGFLYIDGNAQHDFFRSYIETGVYLPQHMLLSYGIIYFVLPRYIFKNKYWLGLTGIFILIVAAALFSPMIQALVLKPLRVVLNFSAKDHSLLFSFMGGLRGSMTIAGFAVAIKLVKHWYFKHQENQALEREKLKAELYLLRGQLHPHFIFNSLNSIYSLALKKSDETPATILKLSELMRYMFVDCSGNIIALSKEISIIQNYIELSKARYKDRLDLVTNIEGDFANKFVPPLIFLPFIENSFKYGASEMLEHAWISLDLLVDGHVLKFKLINGKPSSLALETISSGTGLRNAKKRLQMLYPAGHELRITEDEDTFIVTLTLDLSKNIFADKNEEALVPVSR